MNEFSDTRRHRFFSYSLFIWLGRTLAANRKLRADQRSDIRLTDRFISVVSRSSYFTPPRLEERPTQPEWVAVLTLLRITLALLVSLVLAFIQRASAHVRVALNRVPLFLNGPELCEYRHRHR